MENHTVEILSNNRIVFDGIVLIRAKMRRGNRSIYRTKDFVIKVDRPSAGYGYQCENEYKFWERAKNSQYAQYFVPVIQYGESSSLCYTIQPRVKLSKKKRFGGDIRQLVKDICKFFTLSDVEYNYGNWTVTDGKLQIFDYGFD